MELLQKMTQTSNKIKDNEQRKALNAWWGQKGIGSIIAGTGFGKSRCGVLAVRHVLGSGDRALVLVPTTQLQDQFKQEFIKWGCEDNTPTCRNTVLSISA